MTREQVKRKLPRKLGLIVAIGAVGLMVSSALAFHVGSVVIEMDGNIANDATPGTDWGAIFNSSGQAITANLPVGTLDTTGVIQDFKPGASGPDTSYHAPSNKDEQAINAAGPSSVWGCNSVANPTDKDDIVNAYAIATTGQGEDAGDLIVNFGVERFDNSGTAFLGFWLFQADVTCDLATSKFVGKKTTGDVLLLANFSNGGSNITIQAFKWTAGAGINDAGTFSVIGQGVKCSVSSDNNGNPAPGAGAVDMCAQVNETANVPTPWAMEDKEKPGPPSPDLANILEPAEFVEGGINLTDAFHAAGITPPACFGAFMAETRSSDTLSATLKDFALGDLNTCDARVTIGSDATNRVGESHTFTVHADAIVGGVATAAQVGQAVVTLTNSNGAAVSVTAATCTVAGNASFQHPGDNLDANGNCTVTFTSPSTGIVTGNVSVDINLSGTHLIRDTDPGTVTIGSGPGGSGPAVKKFVDAKIAIAPDATNRVGSEHTFTITVSKDTSAAGLFIAAAGETVTGSIVNTNGSTSVFKNAVNTCTTNASGQCTLTITGPTTGVATVSATSVLSVEGKSITVTTDGTLGSTGPAVKKWVDAKISIGVDGTNRVGVAHTFTITVQQDSSALGGFALVGGVTVTGTITNSAGSTATFVGGVNTCTTASSGATLGTCTLTVNSPTTGQASVSASASVTVDTKPISLVTNGQLGSSVPATKTWVDAKIAIVGNDTDGITESHTFTVTLSKDLGDGNGFVGANGEDVDVTLTAVGAIITLNAAGTTCDIAPLVAAANTTGGGHCAVVFTSNVAGTVTGSATSSLTVGGVPITVTTDGLGLNSGTVLKTFVSGSIIWHKNDNHGNRLLGATFEICRTSHIDTSPIGPDVYITESSPVCFSVKDNDATDEDSTAGNFLVSGLVVGAYTARETLAPAGYHIDNPNAVPFDDAMTIADPNIEIAIPFTNSKAFRLFIYTCDDISHLLVVSAVDFDGNPLTTGDQTTTMSESQFLALGWKNAAGDPLSQADFCSATLPGANYGPLDEGTYHPSVKIPQ